MNKLKIKPGDVVLIIEDLRDEERLGPDGKADGKPAMFINRFDLDTGEIDKDWGNPLFKLEDSSSIFGIECWWGTLENAPPLDEAKRQLEEKKARLREMFLAIHEQPATVPDSTPTPDA